MRNLTISVKETVARWARSRAAERDTTVSRMIGELLEQLMRDEAEYDRALALHESHRPRTLHPLGRRPARGELHERSGVR